MFEINYFDAVRISLASPEQIPECLMVRSRSRKPSPTRTLKPGTRRPFFVKDLWPTKDFDATAANTNGYAIQGVICDKCGVEVARAKVRRERMANRAGLPCQPYLVCQGHPQPPGPAAGPFSPQLEHVLYFSQFIYHRDTHRSPRTLWSSRWKPNRSRPGSPAKSYRRKK